jgi:biopolymer transport protein ExbD
MNVTPLVDVVLVLLIIFMVVIPAIEQGMAIEIPGIRHPDKKSESSGQAFTVSITKEGTVWLDDHEIPWANLEARLKGVALREPGKRVVLRGDTTMAMELGSAQGAKKGRSRPEMNVTPLVDVVLVLLIIFMVLTAVMKEHFWIHVPEKEAKEDQKTEDTHSDEEPPIVISVGERGEILINQEMFPDREFSDRLRRMLIARGERRVYFDARDSVPYARAMQVMDLARGGGAAHIAVVTEKLQD